MAVYDVAGSQIADDGELLVSRKYASLESAYQNVESYAHKYAEETGYKLNGTDSALTLIREHLMDKNLVSAHGQLKQSGTTIVDENNEPVMLRGIAMFHVPEMTDSMLTYNALREFPYFGVNMVRIPIYLQNKSDYSGDYDVFVTGWSSNPSLIKQKVDQIVQECVAIGLYVIIDFHVLGIDGGISNWQSMGQEVISYFSEKYGNYNNVLYEVANEPHTNSITVQQLASYAVSMRNIIRAHNQDAIVICGCNYGNTNVAQLYTAITNLGVQDIFISPHWYMGSERYFATQLASWNTSNIPIFCTEFGNTANNGTDWTAENDPYFIDLIKLFEQYGVSYAVWKYSCRVSGSSVLEYNSLAPDGYYSDGWLASELTHNGSLFFETCARYAFG